MPILSRISASLLIFAHICCVAALDDSYMTYEDLVTRVQVRQAQSSSGSEKALVDPDDFPTECREWCTPFVDYTNVSDSGESLPFFRGPLCGL
jgi:hypothetical protein